MTQNNRKMIWMHGKRNLTAIAFILILVFLPSPALGGCCFYDLSMLEGGSFWCWDFDNSADCEGGSWYPDLVCSSSGSAWSSCISPTTTTITSVDCSTLLTYPTDKWHRVWYDYPAGTCLGDTPSESYAYETNEQFDDNWASNIIAYGKSDQIQMVSGRKIYFPTAGIYIFKLGSDDGSRLKIDGTTHIEDWSNHGYRVRADDVYMAEGWHDFEIEYYENAGDAKLTFGYYIDSGSSACDTECRRRGYPEGECCVDCYYPPCNGYSSQDLIPSYAPCSGSGGNCFCCHNCPASTPSDTITVGSCSATISGIGWDDSDKSAVGFHGFDYDAAIPAAWRSYWMCDNPTSSACAKNLQFKNSWSVSGSDIIIRTDILGRSAGNDLGAGFNFYAGGCKYTPSLIGTTETADNTIGDEVGACVWSTESFAKQFGMVRDANAGDYLTWSIHVANCGDGICDCDETFSCLTDCGMECTSDVGCVGNPKGTYCDVTDGSPKQYQCTPCIITYNNYIDGKSVSPAISGGVNQINCPSSKNPNNPIGQDLGIIGRCFENSPGNPYGSCTWAPTCISNDECNNKCCNKFASPGPGLEEGRCEPFGTVKLNKWLCKS